MVRVDDFFHGLKVSWVKRYAIQGVDDHWADLLDIQLGLQPTSREELLLWGSEKLSRYIRRGARCLTGILASYQLLKSNFPTPIEKLDNRWFTQPVFHNLNITMKDINSKRKEVTLTLKPNNFGLSSQMNTVRVCDLYEAGEFISNDKLSELNGSYVQPLTHHSLMSIFKDLIGENKKYEGFPVMAIPALNTVDSIGALMTKTPKGSSRYRAIIASKRKKVDIHNPQKWRNKLEDDSITSLQVRLAMRLMHSEYLDPNTRDLLCRFYHSKTLFGAQLLAAGITDDSWCSTCIRESQTEVVERVLHASYECPSVMRVRLQLLHELDLPDPDIPTNPGSVVLATVMPDTKVTKQLSELINLVWAIALKCILKARNVHKTPRADTVISDVKTTLLHIKRVKPYSAITNTINERNMLPLLTRGFTPHTIGNGLDD